MKRSANHLYKITCCLLLLTGSTLCTAAQKPNKRLDFCYWKYEDTASARKGFGKNYAFYRLSNNDTLVDIGAASGGLEGALASFMDVTNIHFILVDIDTNCLNATKVKNVQTYYSGLKGSPLNATFSIVNNTPDSLYLPPNRFRKVLLYNTLHEIPDQVKMVKAISEILKTGGELILGEPVSRPKHTIHGGCRKPLLSEAEIKTLFEQNGFQQTETLMNPMDVPEKKIVNPLYMVRFIKK